MKAVMEIFGEATAEQYAVMRAAWERLLDKRNAFAQIYDNGSDALAVDGRRRMVEE